MGGSGLFVGFFSVSTTSFALFRQNNFFKHLGCPPLTSTPENVWEKQSLGKSPETLFSSIHECHRNYMSSCQFVEYVWIMWGCKIICLLCQFYFWEKVLSHQLVPLPLLCFVLSPNDQILETTRRRNLLTKKTNTTQSTTDQSTEDYAGLSADWTLFFTSKIPSSLEGPVQYSVH